MFAPIVFVALDVQTCSIALAVARSCLNEATGSPLIWIDMSKFFALLFVGLMLVQVIRPLGLPGLKRRKDAWKLAVAGLAVMMAAIFTIQGFKAG